MIEPLRIGLSVDAASVADALDRLPDYKVLRRLVPLERSRGRNLVDDCLVATVLDVETTGLDPRQDSIIELAMQRIMFDTDGAIVEVGAPRRWLEDPGHSLPAEIVRLTGITDQDVAGRMIIEAEATGILLGSDVVIAHNASFDRPFCERRLPIAKGRPWVCTLAEVDWRGHGFEGRTLGQLLAQVGWFYEAHQATIDVAALIRLLDHRLEDTGRTVLATAMEAAARRSWIVEAVGAAFDAKDLLKGRGYRWNPVARTWWREVDETDFDGEVAWTIEHVYAGDGRPNCVQVDWTRRHAAR